MRRSNFALRLQPSLMEEVRKAAEMEGVALNQLINVAVAEKLSALRTEEYFRARSSRANRTETMRILARAGRNNEPISGDEVPENRKAGRSNQKGSGHPPAAKTARELVRREKGLQLGKPKRHNQRIFLPRAERTSSTPRRAVRLCSSMMGLISTTSRESMASESAIISMARWASR